MIGVTSTKPYFHVLYNSIMKSLPTKTTTSKKLGKHY